MSHRKLFYADALQGDEDINRILLAFSNVTISDPPPPPHAPSPSPTVISISDSDSDVQDHLPTVTTISDSASDVQDRPPQDNATGERDYLVSSGLETGCIESWYVFSA